MRQARNGALADGVFAILDGGRKYRVISQGLDAYDESEAGHSVRKKTFTYEREGVASNLINSFAYIFK